MAVSGSEKIEWKPLRSKLPRFDSKDLDRKKLIVNFESLRPIAKRAIQSLERRESYHPHTLRYIYSINITILDDLLFRNLNLHFIFSKKKEGVNID